MIWKREIRLTAGAGTDNIKLDKCTNFTENGENE